MKEELPISTENYRINQQIRTKEVRLIGPDGQNVGVVAIQEALNIANEAELDLVEVAPNSEPPVCRVMDFGKFIYEREKKEREARKSQAKVEVKEIRLRPKTNPYHQGFKLRDARRWLETGIKVKVRFHFRGREITYPELVLVDMQKIANELSDVGVIEQAPGLEGRSMLMILAPARTKGKKNPPKKIDSEEKKIDS
jgi:translation initiation factor IF-3